jgi:hypothetical protein
MKRTAMALIVILVMSTLAVGQQAKPTVSLKYVAAAEALAADDFAKAKTALTDLAKESQGEIKARAQAAADATTIAAMRKSFKPLSEAVVKMGLPAGHVVAFCPMFEGGGSWVQKGEKIANPYYGKSMLTCGEVKK